MKKRVISAVIMLAIVGFCVVYSDLSRLILVWVGSVMGVYETVHAFVKMDRTIPRIPVVCYPIVEGALCFFNCPVWTQAALFVGLAMFIMCDCIVREELGAEGAFAGLFALCYPGAFFAAVVSIVSSEDWMVPSALAFFATIVCDMFALFGGLAFGKHKLCPEVSPKKTWEGSVTGAVFSMFAGVGVHFLIPGAPSLTICVVVSLISSTAGQFGDLAASLIKRRAGLKDYSNLIPGHGGIMDRADSLLFSVPTAWLLLEVAKLFD